MISTTKGFAHFNLTVRLAFDLECFASLHLRNVTPYFCFRVKLVLNWKSGIQVDNQEKFR